MLEHIEVPPDPFLADMVVTAYRLASRAALRAPQFGRLFDPQPHHAIQLAARGAVFRGILAARHPPLPAQAQEFMKQLLRSHPSAYHAAHVSSNNP